MEAQDPSVLFQALLTRLDHIEFRLCKDQQEETRDAKDQLADVREEIMRMHKARIMEQEDRLLADTLAAAPRASLPCMAASHRGP